MNVQKQFNVIEKDSDAPQFPEFKIDDSDMTIEQTIYGHEVSFALARGKYTYLGLTVEATVSYEEIGIETSNDPQDGIITEYEYLVVENDVVGIVYDFDEVYAIEGMPVRLTEDQVTILNQKLKEKGKEEFLKTA